MLIIVVADNKPFRTSTIEKILAPLVSEECIVLDDTLVSPSDLEHYLYPSLFSTTVPVVRTRFLFDGKSTDLSTVLVKKLVASPTIFIIEEFTIPTAILTICKKHGALVHSAEKTKSIKKESTIFNVTRAITAGDKKSRWMAYREGIQEHAVEAVLGILYWKIRDVLLKNPSERNRYTALYTKLMNAHAKAWESGAPLELLIEKVILFQ